MVPHRSLSMSYKYHVFISYARVNDALTGWVSSFKQKLEGKLSEKLPGETARVFLDVGGMGVGPLQPELRAAVSGSAILMIILSNRWLERPWCQEELASFVEAVGGPSKAQERIVLVRIEDVKQSRLPEVLRDCRLYDFFKVHPTRKVTLTYGLTEFPELESDYLLSMLELVGDEDRPGLVTRLVELTAPEAPTVNPAEGNGSERRVIFLANCTPDLNRDRSTLKRHLEDKGFQVLPTGTFYHAPPRYEEEFRGLLARSTLFIQIVGPFRYELTEHFPAGYEVWQLEQARDIKSLDVLRWRRPDLLGNAVEDDAHREFVFADDVTKCDLEEFKLILDDKLREIDSRRSRTDEQNRGRTVLVNAAASDNKMAEGVGTKVEDLCIEMDLGSSIYADVVGERSSLFDVARNNPCDGLMIVYGECEDKWVRRQMMEGRNAALLLKQKVPICALYVGPPEDKPPLEPRPARFGLINFREEDQLRSFVRNVAERKM
jgi:TIR domain